MSTGLKLLTHPLKTLEPKNVMKDGTTWKLSSKDKKVFFNSKTKELTKTIPFGARHINEYPEWLIRTQEGGEKRERMRLVLLEDGSAAVDEDSDDDKDSDAGLVGDDVEYCSHDIIIENPSCSHGSTSSP